MNSKSKYAILLISSVLVIYAIIGGMLGRVSAQNGSFQQLSIFTEVLGRIQNDYVDDPNMKTAVDGAMVLTEVGTANSPTGGRPTSASRA